MAFFAVPGCGKQTFEPRTKVDFGRIREKLRSEYGPAVQSEAEVARALNDVDKDLEDCEAEVHRLESRIILLHNQRERLEEYKSCLRSLICPIRRIPNEILTRIFDYTCDINEVLSRDLKKMPALTLSSVCSRWRLLAKGCPILWARVKVELPATVIDPRDLLTLKLHLAYSDQSPLTIEVDGVRIDDHLPILDALTELSHRWQRLQLARGSSWFMMKNPCPLLEALEAPSLKLSKRNMRVFQDTPKLRRLAVATAPFLYLPAHESPWKQLTSFEFGFPLPSEQSSIVLEACSHLTELHLRELHDGPFKRCARPQVTPVLETLSLTLIQTVHSQSLAEEAFASLTSPSLTSLVIHGPDIVNNIQYVRVWPKENLHAFLSRSSCHLTTFSITHVPLSDTDLTELLPLLPSLLNLTIHDSPVATDKSPLTSRFVNRMHAFRGTSISSALVPALQSLSLTSRANPLEGFKDKEFVDMVSSRWLPDPRYAAQVGVACLRSVVMRFSDRDVDEEIYKPLKHLEKAGMRIVVIGKS